MSGVMSWNKKCNRCGIEKSFLDYECNTGEGNDGCSVCGASTTAYMSWNKAASADCEMEAVTFPASVTEIGEYAFGYNRELDKRGDDGAEIGFEKINGFEYKLLSD